MARLRCGYGMIFMVCALTALTASCKLGVRVVEPNASQSVDSSVDMTPLRGSSALTIEGESQNLEDFSGKVVLVVNTASNCGFTGQYEGLEAIYNKYRDRGFVVLGFPCNDFGDQEPGTEEQIQGFCTEKFNVTFPLFSKVHVLGAEKHMLYTKLTERSPEDLRGDIQWNFTKFLLDRSGRPVARFAPFVEPESDALIESIERALTTKK